MATEIIHTPGEWRGPETNNLQARRDAANARLTEQNRARQSAAAQPEETFLPLDKAAAKLVHELGLSNQAESDVFVEQFLSLHRDNETLGLLIVQLQSEVSALKERVTQLERKRGLPIKAETR